METESYSISFFGLSPKYYTTAIVGDIWDVAATRVYEETGISVSGEIHDRYFVSPGFGELNGSIIYMIESKRIPGDMVSNMDYWNALKVVVGEVREKLGNPGMTLTVESVVLTYFERI